MRGVTITDADQDGRFLTVELIDILRLLGSSAEDAEWEISEVEAVGSAADEVHQLADCNARVPGRTLLELAGRLTQVIDGSFVGYRVGEDRPWIIVRAIDSSAYDVESEDEIVLARMQQRFRDVAELASEGTDGG